MKKRILFLLCMLQAVCGAFGMPTDVEIEKVKPIIRSLTANSFAELKAGKKSRSALADELLGYVRQADTEAARFLLIQSAFNLYMGEGNCGKAVDAYGMLLEQVKDVPVGTFGRWGVGSVTSLAKAGNAAGAVRLLDAALDWDDIDSAIMLSQRISRAFPRPVGHLAETLTRVAELDKRQKRLKKLRADLEVANRDGKPTAALHEEYGMALVENGDWPSALAEFALAEGKLAEIAESERASAREKGMSVLIADYWWDRAEKIKGDVAVAIRIHAAEWYRTAIADGSLSGLKQVVAEKRLKSVGKTALASPKTSSPRGGRNNYITIDMGDGVSMTFMSCPAGTFTMGYPDGRHEFFPHKVTITRPFWMSKYHVSGVQYNRMGQPIRTRRLNIIHEAREALGGDKAPQIDCTINDILSFAEWMTDKYRNVLPDGYIIRPPTMAEWEYACRAGGNIERDWYAKPHLTISEKSKYAWTFEERWEILKNKGIPLDSHNLMVKSPWYFLPPSFSESKPLNAWGIGDLYGNVYPLFLDTFPQSFAGRSEGDFVPGKPNWSGMNTDPLFWCDDPNAAVVSQRDTEKGWGEMRHFIRRDLRFPSNGFRLVIGPDLVKEMREGRTVTTAVGDNRSTGVNLPQTQKPELETGEKKQPSDLSNKPITVDMGMGRTMEFMACPAGTFNMGYQYASQYCFYLHKVTITRPFWIGKFPVTVDQWMRVASRIEIPQESRPVLTALGGDILPQTCCSRDEAGAFASRMNILFKKYLPAGYVFRLPTMAEWEYACRANGDVTSDWFAKPLLSEDEQKRYAITPQEKLTVLTRKGITGDKIKQQVASYYSIPFPVGTKPANRWGVCDLLGNVNEWMLDTFPATTYSTNPDMRWTSVGWLRNDRDPLFWATAKDFDGCFHANCRCEGWGTKRFMIKRSTKNPSIGFRLVVGPDLVKEQKRGASK